MLKVLVVLLLLAGIAGGLGWFAWDTYFKPQQQQKIEAALPPPTPPPDPALPELRSAEKLVKEGKLDAAKAALMAFLENYPQSSVIEQARQLLGEVNGQIFFSNIPSPEKETYTVQRGDALAKIQRRFKASPELIMRVNNLTDPTRLQVGQQLFIPRVDFSMVIDRNAKKIVLLNQGSFFKQYAIVKWNGPTRGKVSTKVSETAAWRNGERVAFGTKDFAGSDRWILLAAPGYTIYGEPGEQEQEVTRPQGGIGVAPEDAEELAALVSRGVPVTIE